MSLPNRFHKTFRTMWFSCSQFLNFFASLFCILCLLIDRWFSWFCVYLEACLSVNFPLVFHYNTSKPEASNADSSLFIVHCSKQHKHNVVGVRNLVDLIVGRVLAVWAGCMMCLECGVQFMKLILGSCEYGYQIMKLFITRSEIY